MKVLVLSDIHYPYTDTKLIKRVIEFSNPDRIIVTGDVVVNKDRYEDFINFLSSFSIKVT